MMKSSTDIGVKRGIIFGLSPIFVGEKIDRKLYYQKNPTKSRYFSYRQVFSIEVNQWA